MNSILENWCAGLGLPGVLVIDCHTHIGTTARVYMPPTADDAAKVILRQMDAHGVDAAVNLGRLSYVGGDYSRANDEVLWIHEHSPRIIGFCLVNPTDEAKYVLAELERMHQSGLRGIKLIHTYQENYPVDGPVLKQVYRFAAEHGMMILNHDWQREDALRAIAAQYPDMALVLGHYGPRWDPVLRDCPNVYACTWSFTFPREIEQAAQRGLADKLLFGTDSYLNPLASGLGVVVFARIPDEDKRKILGLTEASLLARVGALPENLRGC